MLSLTVTTTAKAFPALFPHQLLKENLDQLGIEQLYRDNRITPIYEGTNSVQAADLVFRKLVNKNGNIIKRFLDMIKIECDSKNEKVKSYSKELNYYLDILYKFTG